MSTVVDVERWAMRQAMWWQRLRQVLAEYQDDAPRVTEPRVAAANVAQRHFLADVLAMIADTSEGRHLEMDLALAAHDAGIKIRTGVLRMEQEWAAKVQPIPTGHLREQVPTATQEGTT